MANVVELSSAHNLHFISGFKPTPYEPPESHIARHAFMVLPATISASGQTVSWSCPYCDRRHREMILERERRFGAVIMRRQSCRGWWIAFPSAFREGIGWPPVYLRITNWAGRSRAFLELFGFYDPPRGSTP